MSGAVSVIFGTLLPQLCILLLLLLLLPSPLLLLPPPLLLPLLQPLLLLLSLPSLSLPKRFTYVWNGLVVVIGVWICASLQELRRRRAHPGTCVTSKKNLRGCDVLVQIGHRYTICVHKHMYSTYSTNFPQPMRLTRTQKSEVKSFWKACARNSDWFLAFSDTSQKFQGAFARITCSVPSSAEYKNPYASTIIVQPRLFAVAEPPAVHPRSVLGHRLELVLDIMIKGPKSYKMPLLQSRHKHNTFVPSLTASMHLGSKECSIYEHWCMALFTALKTNVKQCRLKWLQNNGICGAHLERCSKCMYVIPFRYQP